MKLKQKQNKTLGISLNLSNQGNFDPVSRSQPSCLISFSAPEFRGFDGQRSWGSALFSFSVGWRALPQSYLSDSESPQPPPPSTTTPVPHLSHSAVFHCCSCWRHFQRWMKCGEVPFKATRSVIGSEEDEDFLQNGRGGWGVCGEVSATAAFPCCFHRCSRGSFTLKIQQRSNLP